MGAATWRDSSKQTRHNRKAPFFKLPAEIRNTIYELCLIQQGRIKIKASDGADDFQGLPSGLALLRTCTQARRECMKIYFGQNTFSILVENYDIKPHAGFLRQSLLYGAHGSLDLIYTGDPSWANVVHWLKMVYSKQCVAPMKKEGYFVVVNDAVIESMFATVERLSPHLTWEAVLRLLRPQRKVLAVSDERWHDDGGGNSWRWWS